MKYYELKKKHSDEMNAFTGIFWAFNNRQFKEGMEKIGLNENDTELICTIGGGGYMIKEKKQEFIDMLKRFDDETKEQKKENKFILDALVYELKNHEYCITGDPSDALDVLGWNADEIEPSILKKALKLAE